MLYQLSIPVSVYVSLAAVDFDSLRTYVKVLFPPSFLVFFFSKDHAVLFELMWCTMSAPCTGYLVCFEVSGFVFRASGFVFCLLCFLFDLLYSFV